MRIAIVGGRDYPDLEAVWIFVKKLAERCPDAVIISGGARGVDTTAAASGRVHGLTVVEYEPEWDKYGPRVAPLMRNTTIIDDCDKVVAFWDGVSTGTKDSMTKAEDRGKKVTVVPPRR